MSPSGREATKEGAQIASIASWTNGWPANSEADAAGCIC